MNENYKNWDHQHVWHPFTQMKEYLAEDSLVIERAEGNYVIDTEGHRYLDAISSLWVNVHGHAKKEINDAIKAQLDKIAHSTLLGSANIPATELAKKLVDLVHEKLKTEKINHVFYSDNGSTAVEVALKIAFEYWQLKTPKKEYSQKQKFVSFRDAYHGDTIGAVSVGHIEMFHEIYRPLLFPTIQAPSPKDPECLDWVKNRFKKDAQKIAAVVIEPLVQGAGGMIVQPDGFLKKLKSLCEQYEVLFIADEVATGFGRTGTMFACEQEGVVPDLMCLAKGLTGGYLPLAATLATSEIYEAFLGNYSEYKTFFHGHSYTGNQLGCAAALANLDIFEKEKVLESLPSKIQTLTESLQRLKSLSSVIEIRQKGLMVGIEIGPYPLESRVAHKLCLAARKKHILIRPLGNTIVLMPPLSITEDEINLLCAVVYDLISAL
ncbi:MAG: adenosylmethionine--8-amino-7-oxononanoate transaminase [Deltaproteobacteria bacterium]|nr:MAG: adenosylmethionine--8-amino-7-oxononanoate transaminase [Deltaproteobacteria bacterium]